MFLPPSIPAGITLLVAPPLVGWWLARRLLARRPEVAVANVLRCVPAVGFAFAAALVLPLGLVWLAGHERVALRLPFAVQYWGPTLVWGAFVGLLGVLNFFAVSLAWAERHAERRKLLAAALLLAAAFGYMQFYYTRPLAPALTVEHAPDGSILQTSDASCAPAAGANLARRLGVAVSERQLAEAMYTTRMFGSAVPQIVAGLARAGINCDTWLLDGQGVDRVPLPALLFVDHPAVGREGHVVALLGRDGERYELVDPLYGRERPTAAGIEAVWHGLALACRRG